MSETQDNLMLYHAKQSLFSQKVAMALRYLNLKFDEKLVDYFSGEQLETWYLDINPKGEVPTLKDGETIVSDSAAILQYLNDTYDTRKSDEKMIPDQVTPLGQNVASLNEELCSVRAALLTFGSIFHPQHTQDSEMTEVEKENRKGFLAKLIKEIEEKLKTAESPYKETYNYKLTKMVTGKAMFEQEENLLEEIDRTKDVMEKIERQLIIGEQKKWLFGDHLTIADITMLVLLRRIFNLGLQHHFFADNANFRCLEYYRRALMEPYVSDTLA